LTAGIVQAAGVIVFWPWPLAPGPGAVREHRDRGREQGRRDGARLRNDFGDQAVVGVSGQRPPQFPPGTGIPPGISGA
jgi:hypothetical protein